MQTGSALYKLRTEAGNPNRSLYANNQEVCRIREGVPVKVEAGEVTETLTLSTILYIQRGDFNAA